MNQLIDRDTQYDFYEDDFGHPLYLGDLVLSAVDGQKEHQRLKRGIYTGGTDFFTRDGKSDFKSTWVYKLTPVKEDEVNEQKELLYAYRRKVYEDRKFTDMNDRFQCGGIGWCLNNDLLLYLGEYTILPEIRHMYIHIHIGTGSYVNANLPSETPKCLKKINELCRWYKDQNTEDTHLLADKIAEQIDIIDVREVLSYYKSLSDRVPGRVYQRYFGLSCVDLVLNKSKVVIDDLYIENGFKVKNTERLEELFRPAFAYF